MGVLAFAQASFAFASCPVGRSALGQTMGSPVSMESPCDTAVAIDWTKYPNRCFGHCTADLQTVGAAVALVRSPADAPVLVVADFYASDAFRVPLQVPRLGSPPPRILFHSFLI
ncbi:MAG: hypothetical protein AB1452_02905 [Pseudomonadota bacterium]